MKRVVRLAIFGPLFLVALTGLVALSPLLAIVDWCTTPQYRPSQTVEQITYIIRDTAHRLWAGQM